MMNRTNRKAMAQETLGIVEEGGYTLEGIRVDLAEQFARSARGSRLFTPEEGARLLDETSLPTEGEAAEIRLVNQTILQAIRALNREGVRDAGALNFASAKNPGGGFLGGSLAQEESLAVAGNLYATQRLHPAYYEANRACGTMLYTDHAIFSPEVVFFRDNGGRLVKEPDTASVLTLPAVNYGQVLLKKEDPEKARAAMRRRMALSLALFAHCGAEFLVLGAYGCGVFRNDPATVAAWWRELLEEGWGRLFRRVVFAVLDKEDGPSIRAFRAVFGEEGEG